MRRASTLFILTCCLCVSVFGIQLRLNFEKWMLTWGQGLQINVYVQGEKIKQVKSEIEKMEPVQQVSLITAEQSFNEFQAQMAGLTTSTLNLDDLKQAIPESLLVTLKGQTSESQKVEQIQSVATEIKKISGVESVEYGQAWVQQFSEFVRGFDALWFLLGAIVFSAVCFMIFNSIRVMVLERKTEIEILELLGADSLFIQKSFLLEGILLGFVSSALALVLNYGLFGLIQSLMSKHTILMQLSSQLENIDYRTAIVVLFVGSLLGLVSAFLSVRKINTGWSAAVQS